MTANKSETELIEYVDAEHLATITHTDDGWYSQSRGELDMTKSFDQVFEDAGLLESDVTFLGSSYRVIQDKSELINRAFGIRAWRFSVGEMGPFVICYCVIKDNDELVLMTDGSTGILAQLTKVTNDRLSAGHPTPVEYLKIVNGLRVSEYKITESGRPAKDGDKVKGTARTYYLA